ncbi:MAG: hypothetical protein KAS62_10755, partial [Candidatus Delongbacteria bacterium]|nr:hypothetical protein [Candidatus Delongbacteria bacterium]
GITPTVFEYDNFEDGVADNWTEVTGIWAVIDSISVYECTLGVETVATSLFNTAMTGNYVFETKVRESIGFGGLIMNGDHSVLNGDADWNNCVVFMINGSDYTFVVIENGVWSSTSEFSPEINTVLGEWNTLKVIVNNDTGDYHLYINGVYIASVNDTTFNGGELGLHMAVEATVEFDFVSISDINKSAIDNIDIEYVKLEPSLPLYNK